MTNQIQLAGLARRSHLEVVEQSMVDAGMSIEKIRKECSFALQLVSKSPQLQKCTLQSLQSAVINVANTGLTLNPIEKLAYLVPRWNSSIRGMEVTLDPSYMGLIHLAADSGGIKSILAQIVYEGDKGNISINISDNKNPVIHNINPFSTQKGNIVGLYAIATFPDGTRQAEFMDLLEIFKIRERSETYKAFKQQKIKSCTWETDFGEMARKTIIKRLIKYLPFVSSKLNIAIDASHDYAAIEQINAAPAEPKKELPISETQKKIKIVSSQIRELLKSFQDTAHKRKELNSKKEDFKNGTLSDVQYLDALETYRDDLDLELQLNQSKVD